MLMQQITGARRVPWLVWAIVALVCLSAGSWPTTAHAQAGDVRPAVSDPNWQAQYWNNMGLSGEPALTRTDTDINFNWGNGAPWPEINSDQFSARWTRYIYFPTDGVYRFTLTSDDGSRFFLDDQLIVDGWYDHATKTFVVDRNLRAGHHLLRVEYYDNVGAAVVQFSWIPVGQQQPAYKDWKGEYFNNRELLGDPVLVRNDPAVDFNWGRNSPQPGVVNSDNFSVRWTRTLSLPKAVYRFRTTVDDGVRVYVNNRLVIDQWRIGPAATFESPDIPLSGATNVRVESFDALEDARIQLLYLRVDIAQPTAPPVVEGWQAEYYNNNGVAGSPALVRVDPNIDFAWGLDSPAPGVINADDFSVRWTRTLAFQPGNYRFRITVDDGARLWVNNALVIDQWRQSSPPNTRVTSTSPVVRSPSNLNMWNIRSLRPSNSPGH